MRKLEKSISDLEVLEKKRVEIERQKQEIKTAIEIMETDEMQKALKKNKLTDKEILLFITGLNNKSIEVKTDDSGKLFVNGKEVIKEEAK